jgi:hypothetical protein
MLVFVLCTEAFSAMFDGVGNEKSRSNKSVMSPALWLTLGVAAGAVTALLAFVGSTAFTTAFGAITAVIAIALTYLIAKRQDSESVKLGKVVSGMDRTVDRVDGAVGRVDVTVGRVDVTVGRVDGVIGTIDEAVGSIRELVEQSAEILRDLAERDSALDYDPDVPEPAALATRLEDAKPRYEQEAIAKLRAKHALLDYDNLRWQAKKPEPPQPGNHGWFVESPSLPNSGRWFVRKAKGMTARKAMPREFLRALETDQGVNPRTIALDYQIKGHALAAWYARTYEGSLYKVWRPNAAVDKSIRTERVEE